MSDLPWARAEGEPPAGTGVCLSGGGIRAASFGLGAIQALQAERGLLFGPGAADHLAVVSGGSYVGATFMLNASALAEADEEPAQSPLEDGSPEAAHVVANGRYLVERGLLRTAARLAVLGAWNVAAVAILFAWTGTMLADLAFIAGRWGPSWVDPPDDPLRWILALAALAGATVMLRGGYIDGGPKRALYPLAGILVLAATAPSLVSVLRTLDEWWDIGWWWLVVALGSLAVVGLSAVPPRLLGQPLWWVVAEVSAIVPRLAGLVLLTITAVAAADAFDDAFADDVSANESLVFLAAFFGVLLAGWAFSHVSHRVSLHRFYRDGLSRCFSVRRDGAGVVPVGPTETLLSAVSPDGVPDARRFPRLLVCATANVIWRDGERRRRFAPFVFSHDRCGVPGSDDLSFATEKLECGRVPVRVLHRDRERLVSLMTAVASTGAAVSPSMGNRTYPALRPLIAILNLRLGRWLPNPLSPATRARVEATTEPGDLIKGVFLGKGYDEFVPELFGLHRADGVRVYVSDGGHYDNLGLLALLQARCEEIWCVDSDADADGDAGQLRTVFALAGDELGACIDVDLDRFKANAGVLGAGFAIGSIAYRGGGSGRIVVVKLGLTPTTPPPLAAHRDGDAKWPYHSTFLAGQWYPSERMDAYRRLGYENARAACAAADQSAGFGERRAKIA